MLKPISAVVVTLLISSPAISGEKPSPEEFCRSVSVVAEGVMEARQFGASLNEALDRIAKNPLSREIVLSAYEVDLRYSEAARERAIGVFRDDWTLRCYRGELATLAP